MPWQSFSVAARAVCVTFTRSVSHAASCARVAFRNTSRAAAAEWRNRPPSSRFRNTLNSHSPHIKLLAFRIYHVRPNSEEESQRSTYPETSYERELLLRGIKGAPESRRPTYALHWFPARVKIIRSSPAERQHGRPSRTTVTHLPSAPLYS